MSGLNNRLKNRILLFLCIVTAQAGIAGVLGDKIDQDVAAGGTGVVHTGTGNVHIGITLEQYEQGLKRREAAVTQRLEKAHAQERKLLERQLNAIQQRLQDAGQSYQEHIKDLRKRIAQLESIRGVVPDDLLDQAQAALARGDSKQADKLFKQVEDQAQGPIKAAAEAAYQRCRLAQDDIRYQQAFSHCKRAQQLVPENTIYRALPAAMRA